MGEGMKRWIFPLAGLAAGTAAVVIAVRAFRTDADAKPAGKQ